VNLDAALAGNLGPWYYPLTLVLVALDAVLPPVPSELLVLGAGPLSAQGSVDPVAAVLVAAAGVANIPWGPFLALSGAGAVLWSTWMVALGYVTGNTTGLPPWTSAVVGMGLGTLVGLVLAGGMAIRARRKGALSHDQHVG
jgi:membrane protein DedA with SNARE-associated domain